MIMKQINWLCRHSRFGKIIMMIDVQVQLSDFESLIHLMTSFAGHLAVFEVSVETLAEKEEQSKDSNVPKDVVSNLVDHPS